jgi:hypothetical protein
MLKLISRRHRLAPRHPSGRRVFREPEPMPRMRWY